MKNIIYLFFLTLLCSCGVPMAKVKQNPELLNETRPFMEEAAKRNKKIKLNKISLRFVNDNSGALGACVISYNLNYFLQKYEYGREIQINAKVWQQSSDSDKQQVMNHELAHCALDRSHNIIRLQTDLSINNYQGGMNKSLMYPSKMPEVYYEGLKEYYYEELFNPNINTRAFIESLGFQMQYYAEYKQPGLCADGTWCGSSSASLLAETEYEDVKEISPEHHSSCEKHIMINEESKDKTEYVDGLDEEIESINQENESL